MCKQLSPATAAAAVQTVAADQSVAQHASHLVCEGARLGSKLPSEEERGRVQEAAAAGRHNKGHAGTSAEGSKSARNDGVCTQWQLPLVQQNSRALETRQFTGRLPAEKQVELDEGQQQVGAPKPEDVGCQLGRAAVAAHVPQYLSQLGVDQNLRRCGRAGAMKCARPLKQKGEGLAGSEGR